MAPWVWKGGAVSLTRPSCRDQLSERCSCFSLSLRKQWNTSFSIGLLWPWGENFNVFQLSPSSVSLSLIHMQVPAQDSPMLWYSTNPNRFGFCFASYSWIHPVNVNMENKYIPMLLQYFEDQLVVLAPLKEGCFYTYQCKMQIKPVIIRMQFKG